MFIAYSSLVSPYSVADSTDSLFLPHHRLGKNLLQICILLHFGTHHLRHRNTCPKRDYLGNIILGNFFSKKSSFSILKRVYFFFRVLYLFLKLWHFSILDLSCSVQVSVSLGILFLLYQLLHLGFLFP